MEKYSFLNYINLKENKFIKYKRILESKINQYGGDDSIELKTIQKELLKIKKKLSDIKNIRKDVVLDPYDKLKDLIEGINAKISNLDEQMETLQDSDKIKKEQLINKIGEISILLDNTSADYTTVTTDTKLKYMKEKIDPTQVAKIFDKYIKDTQVLVDDLKVQIGSGESLVDNTKISENIQLIEAKKIEYETAIKPILNLQTTLNEYIKQMESLYTDVSNNMDISFNVLNLSKSTNPKDRFEKVKVESVQEDKIQFSYFDPAISEDSEVADKELVSSGFIQLPGIPKQEIEGKEGKEENREEETKKEESGTNRKYLKYNTKYQFEQQDLNLLISREKLNETAVDLYKSWNEKMRKIKAINEDILQYKKIQEKITYNLENLDRVITLLSTSKRFFSVDQGQINQTMIQGIMEILIGKKSEIEKTKITCDKLILEFEVSKKLNQSDATECAKKVDLDNAYVKKINNEIVTALKPLLEETKNKIIEIKKMIKDPFSAIQDLMITIIKETAFKKNNTKPAPFSSVKKQNELGENQIIKLIKTNDFKNLKCIVSTIINKRPLSSSGCVLGPSYTISYGFLTFGHRLQELLELLNEATEMTKKEKIESQRKVAALELAEKEKSLNEIEHLMKDLDSFSTNESLQFKSKYSNYNSENFSEQLGGDTAHLNVFIGKLNEFEQAIRDMKIKRKEIIKLIKYYNVRYTQFFNFQKYVVNYVSLVLAQESYEYFQYLSKGTISYYESTLDELEKKINKFENPAFFTDHDVTEEENRLFYTRHYFIIKILRTFFKNLYSIWDTNFNLSKGQNENLWSPANKIKTEQESKNKKYFFLFNIFFRILDKYQSKLPPVANYLRINKIENKPMKNETFNKGVGDKHKLDIAHLQKCDNFEDQSKDAKVNAAGKIDFNEIFDPEQFKENGALSKYMGLGNMLADRKSIMLLTYGYSGTGKSFTLFGKVGKEGESSEPGLLQTTLNDIVDYEKIELKAFELYGLGVPYKFYWEGSRFDHKIFKYTVDDLSVAEPYEFKSDGFKEFLNEKLHYTDITPVQIEQFSTITKNIDTIRENNGRIKATLNNPQSSRSIMIYDFKITFKPEEGKNSQCRFVVMDLPGKENIYQTFCDFDEDDKSKNTSNKKDMFKPQKKFYFHRTGPGAKEGNNKYDIRMIKSMMYINPLWMSMIPEIAEHFDPYKSNHLVTKEHDKFDEIKTLGIYSSGGNVEETHKYLPLFKKINTNLDKRVFLSTESNGHLQGNFVGMGKLLTDLTPGEFSTIPVNDRINLGLYGMWERAFSTILNQIQNIETGESDLESLGKKINDMLENEEARNLRYGFAGLEGIYINENILGLLEVLSEKIQDDRKSKEKVNVVCSQKEIYKQMLSGNPKTPIDIRILQKMKQTVTDSNGNIIDFKENAVVFKEDNEFYSQISVLRGFAKLWWSKETNKLDEDSFFQASGQDKYNTKMRTNETINYGSTTKFIKGEELKNINNNWINNYDYNKIYNIQKPAIKSILQPYLDDSSFRNFYLFFVVSNNLKGDKPENGIETCDKQLQLLYDTRNFMDVIANKAEAIQCDI